jgi:hypothetical protein
MKDEQRFQKWISLPFALALVAFLFPLFTFSCSEKVIAEPNGYELALGVDLEKELGEEEQTIVNNMKAENPKAFEKNPLKLESMPVLYGIFAAILVAGGFAFVSPVGSLVLGVASLTGLWFFIYRFMDLVEKSQFGFIVVAPHVGAYCVSMLLIIGIAMSLAFLIRPIIRKNKE